MTKQSVDVGEPQQRREHPTYAWSHGRYSCWWWRPWWRCVLQQSLKVGHNDWWSTCTARAVADKHIMRKLPLKVCMWVTCAWMALGARNVSPWLFPRVNDFEPPEHVPRTLPRAHTWTQCSRGPPACHVTESKRNDPRAEEQKMPMSKKSSYYS